MTPDPLAIYITTSIFISLLLFWYLASEINLTNSSYGVRRRIETREYDDHRYYEWLSRKMDELEEQHEQEICEDMTLPLEESCLAKYTGSYTIIYERELSDIIIAWWKDFTEFNKCVVAVKKLIVVLFIIRRIGYKCSPSMGMVGNDLYKASNPTE